MKGIPCVLKIYWEDGITIEQRYFRSISAAQFYATANGCSNYKIDRL